MEYSKSQKINKLNEEIFKYLLIIFYDKVRNLELRKIKVQEVKVNNSAFIS